MEAIHMIQMFNNFKKLQVSKLQQFTIWPYQYYLSLRYKMNRNVRVCVGKMYINFNGKKRGRVGSATRVTRLETLYNMIPRSQSYYN